MQKKGLVLNPARDLHQGMMGAGIGSRNPFSLHTDRAKNPTDDYAPGAPGVRGVGLFPGPNKFETPAKKAGGHLLPQGRVGGYKGGSNPFSGPGGKDPRPDSMISGGRGGSPDNSMMFNNKFNHERN
uniref:Uncharacterized protein n=1 Tax=Strombidium inclinatum TaxID=197538 RepID=A0A7S3IJ03_9SPIT|mmetsp:Transcript_21848/g.33843  ORF Transcript_21848/g.33843 Transcript_21848/m.33843 type:complete len:127 (+) Transcript_21848:3589-3969(+)